MSTLKIGTYANKTNFHPGEELAGKVLFLLDKPEKAVEIRLFWYTEGRGRPDVRIVDTVRIDKPELRGEHDFKFTLPAEPYSFAGALISLNWAVELVVLPSNEAERFAFTMSPTGDTLRLVEPQIEEIEVTDKDVVQ